MSRLPAVEIFDHAALARVPWPEGVDGDYAREYLAPMMAGGVPRFIANVRTDLHVARVGERVLPVTVNRFDYGNSYTCSPFSHYVTYTREELRALNQPALALALEPLISGLGAVLRLGEINRVASVNNWMLSTNLFPPLAPAEIWAVTRAVIERFPRHAVVWRSVNDARGNRLRELFAALGFLAVPSRQVYVCDPQSRLTRQSVSLRRDGNLFRRSGYEFVDGRDLPDAAIPRLVRLYDLLYLDKYSIHNPQFTAEFVRLALRHGTLTVRALVRRMGDDDVAGDAIGFESGLGIGNEVGFKIGDEAGDGHGNRFAIDGVIGFVARNGILTTPFFGYDTRLPPAVGLYRMLSWQLVNEARVRGVLLNASSGAASFKRARGGEPDIEYAMVYVRHLPAWRQLPWRMLAASLSAIAVPLLRRLKL